MEDILNQVILGNTVENWLIAAGIIIFGILLITLLKRSVLTRLKSLFERTQNNIDNFILEKIEEYVVPAIYFLIIYWGIRTLDLSAQIRRSEEHTSELQSRGHLVCRLLLEKKRITRK